MIIQGVWCSQFHSPSLLFQNTKSPAVKILNSRLHNKTSLNIKVKVTNSSLCTVYGNYTKNFSHFITETSSCQWPSSLLSFILLSVMCKPISPLHVWRISKIMASFLCPGWQRRLARGIIIKDGQIASLQKYFYVQCIKDAQTLVGEGLFKEPVFFYSLVVSFI